MKDVVADFIGLGVLVTIFLASLVLPSLVMGFYMERAAEIISQTSVNGYERLHEIIRAENAEQLQRLNARPQGQTY